MKKLSCVLARHVLAQPALRSRLRPAPSTAAPSRRPTGPPSSCSSSSCGMTLGITYWAAKPTQSAADFYAAGGGITGFQNGLAIAGDYMSAASFLGISGLVYLSGYDGLIYSVGWLVGWPIVMFLIAERLRNLGKYTFADVASFRLEQTQIRILAACGSLVIVAFYLIAQMVGAGKLIQLLFGLDYWMAVVIVGVLMIDLRHLRRHDGDHLGADHQGLPAARRRDLHGVRGACTTSASPPKRCSPRPSRSIPSTLAIMAPGSAGHRSDLGDLARSGADVRHRRPAAHPDALLHRGGRQGGAQVGVLRHRLHRLLLHPDLHHRLRRHRAGLDQSGVLRCRHSRRRPRTASRRSRAAPTWRRSISPTRSAATSSWASSRRWPSPPSWRWCRA